MRVEHLARMNVIQVQNWRQDFGYCMKSGAMHRLRFWVSCALGLASLFTQQAVGGETRDAVPDSVSKGEWVEGPQTTPQLCGVYATGIYSDRNC